MMPLVTMDLDRSAPGLDLELNKPGHAVVRFNGRMPLASDVPHLRHLLRQHLPVADG